MKLLKSIPARSFTARVVQMFAVVTLMGVLVAIAGPPFLICSDVKVVTTSDCNDSCDPNSGCQGDVYDYQNNGNLTCSLINKYCGTAGLGVTGTDCRATGYYVPQYHYYPAGNPCPPCVRSYQYNGMKYIYDVVTQSDPSCVPN